MTAGVLILTVDDRRQPRRWADAGAALILVAALGAGVAVFLRSPRTAPAPMTAARSVEPRLSGLEWAPYRKSSRSPELAERGRTRGTTRDARHDAGVAQLLANDSAGAIDTLTTAAQAANAPSAWNDLAVALYEAAFRHDAPHLLAEALGAVDRALSLEAGSSEALFNRALILERLGLRDDAREAWERSIARDGSSAWATEARSHLALVAPQPDFLQILDHHYADVARDPAIAARLTSADRQGARGMAIKEVLGRWGEAELSGKEAEAAHHLSVARHLAGPVAADGGDRMLTRAVAQIDSASAEEKRLLAEGHAGYRSGIDQQRRAPAVAEKHLRRAAQAFEAARSPMQFAAHYFAANAAYEQGRRAEALAEHEALLRAIPPEFPAYRGLVLLQLGNARAGRAEWGRAVACLEEGRALFLRLREELNVSATHRTLAFVYQRVGERSGAWRNQLAALKGLGFRSSTELSKAVAIVADAAILRRDWHLARSFLDLEIEITRRISNATVLADALLLRAAARDRLSDEQGAIADIEEAANVAAGFESSREYIEHAARRVKASLRNTPPQIAEALMTEVIEFERKVGDALDLPALHLERARARRRSNDLAGARSDLEQGIREIERHRESIGGTARWGAFHSAAELFEEAIGAALTSGDPTAAFHYAERSRARTLLEVYGKAPRVDFESLPERTAVIAYTSLPERLVIFTADRSGVRAVDVAVARETLRSEIIATSEKLRSSRGRPDPGTARLHEILVKPVAIQLASAETIVFVPDATTATVPFNALATREGAFLLERHRIVIAPSAAMYAAAAGAARPSTSTPSALVIAGSAAGADLAALPAVDNELRQVASAYRAAITIANDDASFDAFRRKAEDADVIHFGGHAVGDERGLEPASLLLREDGAVRNVGVAEIAALHLPRKPTVVLAGCNTARGERRASEGVISVAHGFLMAGAPSVIATLWPIDDSAAATFFPRLHRHLAAGDPPAEALRAAQLESIRKGDVPPSMWAAVQNIGS